MIVSGTVAALPLKVVTLCFESNWQIGWAARYHKTGQKNAEQGWFNVCQLNITQ